MQFPIVDRATLRVSLEKKDGLNILIISPITHDIKRTAAAAAHYRTAHLTYNITNTSQFVLSSGSQSKLSLPTLVLLESFICSRDYKKSQICGPDYECWRCSTIKKLFMDSVHRRERVINRAEVQSGSPSPVLISCGLKSRCIQRKSPQNGKITVVSSKNRIPVFEGDPVHTPRCSSLKLRSSFESAGPAFRAGVHSHPFQFTSHHHNVVDCPDWGKAHGEKSYDYRENMAVS